MVSVPTFGGTMHSSMSTLLHRSYNTVANPVDSKMVTPSHYKTAAKPIKLVAVIRVALTGISLPLFTFGFQTGTPSFTPGSGEAGMSHPVSWFTYC